MAKITLVTGGARSGKSCYALSLAQNYRRKRVFIATAEAFDQEMRLRIDKHRKERGNRFFTIEEPYDPAAALARLPAGSQVVVIDCLTVWLGNLIHRYDDKQPESYPEIEALANALRVLPCDAILVSNEVGMGIVPHNESARRFRDLAGQLNQQVAGLAERVVLMVSGIPLTLK